MRLPTSRAHCATARRSRTACAAAANSEDAVPGLPGSAGGCRDGRCPARSVTTPTSIPASIMRPTFGKQFRPETRCCPTTSGCRSVSRTHVDHRRRQFRAWPHVSSAVQSAEASRRAGSNAGRQSEVWIMSWSSAPSSPAQRIRRAHLDRQRRGARVRLRPLQRLERARRAGLGVPAARTIPVQELRQHAVAMDGNARGTCALSPPRSRGPTGILHPCPTSTRLRTGSAGPSSIDLEVWLQTEAMRTKGHAGDRLSTSNYADAYWTVAQLVATPHRQRLLTA